MKYKVGDRIAIRKDLELSREGNRVVEGMLELAGRILQIREITKSWSGRDYTDAYRVEEVYFIWDDYMIDHEATAKLNETCEGDIPHASAIKDSSHQEICKRLTDMYNQKNTDYGDSFSKSYEKYGNVMAVIRLSDKLNRFENLIKSDAQVDESLVDTLMDLANYAIMTVMEMERK